MRINHRTLLPSSKIAFTNVPSPERKLDDEDLDSGDDEGRTDRAPAHDEEFDAAQNDAAFNFMDAEIARHAIPEPSDGEVCTSLSLQSNWLTCSSYISSEFRISWPLSPRPGIPRLSNHPPPTITPEAPHPRLSRHSIPP